MGAGPSGDLPTGSSPKDRRSSPGSRRVTGLRLLLTRAGGSSTAPARLKRFPTEFGMRFMTTVDASSRLYADVYRQARAVPALDAAAKRPVHAYLFFGP